MTPAALAALARATAVDVLAARGLDPAALPAVTFERPRNPEHGDYATSLALRTAGRLGVGPRDLAGWLADALVRTGAVASAEVAGPGFLNLRLAAAARGEVVREALAAGGAYGRGDRLAGVRVDLVLAPADPADPLHPGDARRAAVADALGRVLAANGAEVTSGRRSDDGAARRPGADPALDGTGRDFGAGDAGRSPGGRAHGSDLRLCLRGADDRVGAAAAAGDDPATVEVLTVRPANLVGGPARPGAVTLRDLVGAVGADAARYALTRSPADSALDVDPARLRRRTDENPVFPVQHAHARTCSALRNAADLGLAPNDSFDLLRHDREGELIRVIGEFPSVVAAAGESREPHRVARYLEELAGAVHRLHDTPELRVLPRGDEEPTEAQGARLNLCAAARQVLAGGLDLLGVSAPERV
ncbi:DALR anticodon-binding domain-containing protein [Saccharothrix algeriensis]|uniref:arginine--tRNA ligase n=3 Tax=Saccharothrix algeriensis TaxID=173560 RepID=A0ABS2SDK9_9PSEU|nr:DALR anticodon-binding domain-containing protein [Saccharothrix algeriensis]MBM7813146.1 arginyl-tRNA synthetase [Saccharothrix algeriensis]